MPTTRARHVVTETDQVAQALDEAGRRWPHERGNRAKLLLRLVEEGYRVITGYHEQLAAERRDAVARTSGLLTGLYGEGYLAELREDWPA